MKKYPVPKTLFLLLFLCFPLLSSFAYDTGPYGTVITLPRGMENPDNPSPVEVVNVLERALIIFIAVVAAVFVIMIGYGAIKASMAAGDPRGLQGAKSTWSNAFLGFMIIVLVYVVLNVAVSLLGGNEISMTAVFDVLREGIREFLASAGMMTPSTGAF